MYTRDRVDTATQTLGFHHLIACLLFHGDSGEACNDAVKVDTSSKQLETLGSVVDGSSAQILTGSTRSVRLSCGVKHIHHIA